MQLNNHNMDMIVFGFGLVIMLLIAIIAHAELKEDDIESVLKEYVEKESTKERKVEYKQDLTAKYNSKNHYIVEVKINNMTYKRIILIEVVK